MDSTSPDAARTYSDLGPPRLVPQLSADGSKIALSPDGLLAVVGDGLLDLTLQVWDTDRRAVVAELMTPEPIFGASFGFSKDGRFIVLAGAFETVLWDAQSGLLLGTVKHGSSYPARPAIRAFGPEPEVLLYDPDDKAVMLQPFRTSSPLFSVSFEGEEPDKLAFAGDKYVVQTERTIRILDRSGKPIESLPLGATATSDGATIASDPLEFPDPKEPPRALLPRLVKASCFEARGRAVCIESRPDNGYDVHLADLRPAEPLVTKLPARGAADAKVIAEGKGLRLACSDDVTGTFGLSPEDPEAIAAQNWSRALRAAKAELPDVSPVAIKGGLLAVTDGAVAVWDLETGKRRFRLADERIGRNAFAPSPDGHWLAVSPGYGATQLHLMDLRAGKIVRTLDHGHSIWGVSWDPAGKVVVSTARMPVGGLYLGDEMASVKIWDPVFGKVLRTFNEDYIASYNADGSLLGTANYNEVSVWDTKTWKKRWSVGGAYMWIHFAENGPFAVTPLVDTSAAHPGLYQSYGFVVHDPRTGRAIQSFGGKAEEISFAPDGKLAVITKGTSYEIDPAARSFQWALVSMSSGKELLQGNGTGVVYSASLEMDGKLIHVGTRGAARFVRVVDRKGIWVLPTVVDGQCEAAFWDDEGHVDGSPGALRAVGFRLGDDLRKAELVRGGPKAQASQKPGLWGDFIAGVK